MELTAHLAVLGNAGLSWVAMQTDKEIFDGRALLLSIVSAGLLLSVIMIMGYAARFRRQKKWNSRWFFVLCVAILLWSVAVFLQHLGELQVIVVNRVVIGFLQNVGSLFTPALVYLHVQKQVSYRESERYQPLLCLAVPAVLMVLQVLQLMREIHVDILRFNIGQIVVVVYNFHFATMILLAMRSILSVFYQMPSHMRRPAAYMMGGVLTYTACGMLKMFWPAASQMYDWMLVAAVVMLRIFYYAFGLISSANVVATSRELVFESLSTMVLVISNGGRILDWNLKKGYQGILLRPKYRETYNHYRQRLLAEAGGRLSPHDESIITFPVNGMEAHYLISTRSLTNERRQLGYLVELSNVTQLYAVFRALEETSTIDQLTGLYNRNAYLQQVGYLVSAANLPLLVLVGDVNNLKPTNDNYGHLAGDALLVAVAKSIRENVPPGSFSARIGGDEFVVLAPRCNEQQGKTFIQKATAALDAMQHHVDTDVGVSWGYAVMNRWGMDYNAVFGAADKMMYTTKRRYAQFRSSGLLPHRKAREEGDDTEGLDDENTPAEE